MQRIYDLPSDAIGLYAFYHRNKCIYIGKAKLQPIRERLKQHWSRCHNARLETWLNALSTEIEFCFLILPFDDIDKMESEFIRKFQPRTNQYLKGA